MNKLAKTMVINNNTSVDLSNAVSLRAIKWLLTSVDPMKECPPKHPTINNLAQSISC